MIPSQDTIPEQKSDGFAFTPITILGLLGFAILWVGCGFVGIREAVELRAAILANTPSIYWSSPGSKIGLFAAPYFIAPMLLALPQLRKRSPDRSVPLPILFGMLFLLTLSLLSPEIIMSVVKDDFRNLAAAHGYEVCITGSGKYRAETLSLPALIQNGACATGTVRSRL